MLLTALLLLGAAPAPACTGDCDGDGQVAINEAVRGVNIALGNAPVGDCAVFDANGDGAVAVNELIAAVSNVLGGCTMATPAPTPTATPGTVTDGSVYLGGEDGITGTLNGVVYTYKTESGFKPSVIELQGDAEVAAGFLERWSIHFPDRAGTYDCSDEIAVGNTYIRLLRFSPAISTGAGSCTMKVTSVGSVFEGSFTGVLQTETGLKDLTAGYFRVHPQR
jgi:hypothetical protein